MESVKSSFSLRRRVPGALAVAGVTALLAACVAEPPRTYAVPASAPAPQRVFVYPAQGQSPEQTERDRYECHLWAVQQTGVDPSRADANASERVVVQPGSAPGANTAAGAIGGAIIGALIGGPRNAGAGLILGGATGAIIGASADASAQDQALQTQAQYNQQSAESASAARARGESYSRALGACLQGRGYTVT